MSMTYSTEYFYGFMLADVKYENVLELALKRESDATNKILSCSSDECSRFDELMRLLADSYSEEFGVDFRYFPANDENQSGFGLLSGYPWQFTEKEKVLTRDNANELLAKITQELKITVAFDYKSILYFG